MGSVILTAAHWGTRPTGLRLACVLWKSKALIAILQPWVRGERAQSSSGLRLLVLCGSEKPLGYHPSLHGLKGLSWSQAHPLEFRCSFYPQSAQVHKTSAKRANRASASKHAVDTYCLLATLQACLRVEPRALPANIMPVH